MNGGKSSPLDFTWDIVRDNVLFNTSHQEVSQYVALRQRAGVIWGVPPDLAQRPRGRCLDVIFRLRDKSLRRRAGAGSVSNQPQMNGVRGTAGQKQTDVKDCQQCETASGAEERVLLSYPSPAGTRGDPTGCFVRPHGSMCNSRK